MIRKQIDLINKQRHEVMQKMPVAETYTGMYSMHKYWSKKPSNLIRDLILEYSKENEIILDPFSGSGVSVIEAVRTKRKAIGIDINPSAIFITRQILENIHPDELVKEYEKIRNDCEHIINELYKIKRNNKTIFATHFIWSNNKLKEIWQIKEDKKKVVFRPKPFDEKLAKSFSYDKIHYYYPTQKLYLHAKINAKANMRVCDLFTPRNTYALSLLLRRISAIKNSKIRELFRFCFSAALGQASRMVFVLNRRGASNGKDRNSEKEVGSWVIGYWIPKENFEINVWGCFNVRFQKILRAKKEQIKLDYETKYARTFYELEKSNALLLNGAGLYELRKIPDNSVDYIITDPPHANRIPYLELSMMWNSWLRYKVNYRDEIVISQAKNRNKTKQNYNLLLGKTLQEIYRVLKPDKYFTLIFNSNKEKTWQDLLKIVKETKLEFHNIRKMGYSANSVVQDNRKGALKMDFVLTFKKEKSK